MSEVVSLGLTLLKVIFQVAPEIVDAFLAWKSGSQNADDPIHVEVSSLLDKGLSDLQAAK